MVDGSDWGVLVSRDDYIQHAHRHQPNGSDPLYQGMPWILLRGDLNGFTATNSTQVYPTLTGLLVAPLSGGGRIDQSVYGGINTSDAEVEIMSGGSSNEPFKSVHIRRPGLYMVEIGLGWYLNWGEVRVLYDITHSDGDQSVLTFRNFVNGTENSYFGGVTDAGAPQIDVHARTMVAVDSRATDVHVRGSIFNHSGTNRTFGTTSGVNIGIFSVNIVQLSPSGNSKPF